MLSYDNTSSKLLNPIALFAQYHRRAAQKRNSSVLTYGKRSQRYDAIYIKCDGKDSSFCLLAEDDDRGDPIFRL